MKMRTWQEGKGKQSLVIGRVTEQQRWRQRWLAIQGRSPEGKLVEPSQYIRFMIKGGLSDFTARMLVVSELEQEIVETKLKILKLELEKKLEKSWGEGNEESKEQPKAGREAFG